MELMVLLLCIGWIVQQGLGGNDYVHHSEYTLLTCVMPSLVSQGEFAQPMWHALRKPNITLYMLPSPTVWLPKGTICLKLFQQLEDVIRQCIPPTLTGQNTFSGCVLDLIDRLGGLGIVNLVKQAVSHHLNSHRVSAPLVKGAACWSSGGAKRAAGHNQWGQQLTNHPPQFTVEIAPRGY